MAIQKVKRYAEQGCTYAVFPDLFWYFDTLNHALLLNILRRPGVPENLAWQAANRRRRYWWTTKTLAVKMAKTKDRLIRFGYYDLSEAYQSVHGNC